MIFMLVKNVSIFVNFMLPVNWKQKQRSYKLQVPTFERVAENIFKNKNKYQSALYIIT